MTLSRNLISWEFTLQKVWGNIIIGIMADNQLALRLNLNNMTIGSKDENKFVIRY